MSIPHELPQSFLEHVAAINFKFNDYLLRSWFKKVALFNSSGCFCRWSYQTCFNVFFQCRNNILFTNENWVSTHYTEKLRMSCDVWCMLALSEDMDVNWLALPQLNSERATSQTGGNQDLSCPWWCFLLCWGSRFWPSERSVEKSAAFLPYFRWSRHYRTAYLFCTFGSSRCLLKSKMITFVLIVQGCWLTTTM